MSQLKRQIEKTLCRLAWSQWTELGVRGVEREHVACLIDLEWLVLLTAVMGASDPRLWEEALDWCARFHGSVSISRLKVLARGFEEPLHRFATALNAVSAARWPFPQVEGVRKVTLSGKSQAPEYERSALLYLRARSLFGVGARADLLVFLLGQGSQDFAIADATELGYSKRNLAEVLDSFAHMGLVEVRQVRNQKRFVLAKREAVLSMVGKVPPRMPRWRPFFELVLALWSTLSDKSTRLQVVEVRNTLMQLEPQLSTLKLKPPLFDGDIEQYWETFSKWILDEVLPIA